MASGLIRSILVPNRGEIAVRIARACREMKIRSVLAHADGDISPEAQTAFDDFVPLGAGESRDTYLNIDRIIEAAVRAGADALHPGYGFLSERAELARACESAGITFIGPPASAMEVMGSKAASRKLMQRLGVPVVPGYDGEEQSIPHLEKEAESIGYPLLVKASGGGGGKGMKIVASRDELRTSVESAQRESLKSFGDARLLLEKYIERSRHIEVQILGDAQGQIIHLFERDCSIQRRHQKVIEESPAPHFNHALRDRMTGAAVAAGRGVAYTNAGTVEFILTPEGEFYFLEMNTRLQVEHPVTEVVVGIDLVRAQIEIAQGGSVPWNQHALVQRGHAIETRVYAEDPRQGFLPQIGRVAVYHEPRGPGVRVDSGIDLGSELTVRFDPLLAKLIVWAETREQCIDRLSAALRDFVILGTGTNIDFLRRTVEHPLFRSGEVGTQFIAENLSSLFPALEAEPAMVAAVLQAGFARPSGEVRGPAATLPNVWQSVVTLR